MPERIARIRREEKRDLDRTDMESMNPNGMFSCRGTIDVSNDSTRASSHSSDNLSLFQRIRILCELKSKGKEERKKRLEEKLSDWLKRRFEGKSLVRKGGRRIEESARIGGDRLVGRGAESGRWRGWVDGRYVGVATPAPARSSQVVAMQSGRVSCRMPRQQLAVTLFRGPRPAARIDPPPPPPLPIVVTPRATPFQAASSRIATVSLTSPNLSPNLSEIVLSFRFHRFFLTSLDKIFSTRKLCVRFSSLCTATRFQVVLRSLRLWTKTVNLLLRAFHLKLAR